MNNMHAKRSKMRSLWQYGGWALLTLPSLFSIPSHGADQIANNPSSTTDIARQTTDPIQAVVTKGNFKRMVAVPSAKYAYIHCGDEVVNTVALIDQGIEGQCGRVTVAGNPVALDEQLPTEPEEGEWKMTVPGSGRIGPYDTVTVLEDRRWGNNNSLRGSNFAYLTYNGKRLMVRPDEHWRSLEEGCNGRMIAGHRVRTTGGFAVLCADAFATELPRPEDATLTIRHWNTKLPCTFGIPTGAVGERRYFSLEPEDDKEDDENVWGPCSQDTAESIEFEAFPSAARILLTDDLGCDKVDAFWIELRTTSKRVTFSALPLDEILTYAPGSIVRPGLQLVGFHRKDGTTITRKLSCIRVTTSSAPPSG